MMSWPNGISARGEFRNGPGHVIDIVPTVLELAGAKPLSNDGAPPLPGQSLVGSFTQSDERSRHDQERQLWWFHDGHKAIRVGDWKAVAPVDESWELYDLAKDRGESIDLAIPRNKKLDELVALWDAQLAETIQIASADLTEEQLASAKGDASFPQWMLTMFKAKEAARPKPSQVLVNGKSFKIDGRPAFLMQPTLPSQSTTGKPWIFYGPTLPAYPDQTESWMHQKFLDAGVAVAGIDLGEAYGSPHSMRYFDALYEHMESLGYRSRPALLGRSRGGLWVTRMAIEHPEKVAGIGGIYPVFDYTSYPGVDRAASVYGVQADELQARQAEFNPIERADVLAKAKIPVFIIHGTDDQVVPLEKNSGALQKVYQDHSQADLIEILEIPGQGHNLWPGFFQCQELIDFLIDKATRSL